MKNLIFAIATVFTSFALLTSCRHSAEDRADWITSKVASHLDLSTDQKAKLNDLKETVLSVRKAHKADRDAHIAKVKTMILSEHLSSTDAKAMVAEHQKFVDDNFDKVFAKLSVFHDSLTPEQKKKAADFLDKVAEHMDQD